MNCNEVNELLHPLVDGELSAKLRRAVTRHLGHCKYCQKNLAKLELLRTRMHELPENAVPPRLAKRISASLPAKDTEQERTGRRWGNLLYLVPSHLFALLLGGIVFSSLLTPYWKGSSSENDFIAAHVRSLMDQKIIQIASNDTHTVAPWFAGKIEFAPKVLDLSEEGFVLLGGRIDLVQSKKVATLAYQRRKHTINLFISLRPGDAVQNSSAMRWTQRGYNAVEWSDMDFSYTAISDLSAQELMRFAKLMSKH